VRVYQFRHIRSLFVEVHFYVLCNYSTIEGESQGDFGFWILDFGFWILDFGFWILDFGFWILDFGFWINVKIKSHIPHSPLSSNQRF
jgi:hypothetical protein